MVNKLIFVNFSSSCSLCSIFTKLTILHHIIYIMFPAILFPQNRAWHCFSFEPEGRMSDVSIISGHRPPGGGGQGRSIINLTLPGASQPFSYHEIRVWCRPPDKQYNSSELPVLAQKKVKVL